MHVKNMNNLKFLKIILIAWVVLFAAGCNQLIAPSSANTPVPVPSTAIKETPIMNEVPVPTPLDSRLEKIVAQAKDDLAKRKA